MEKKIKVLFLTNIPSPYRVDFFNELGKLCDLTVLFEQRSSRNREESWHNNNFYNFNSVFLNGIKLPNDRVLCLEVTKFLKEPGFDLIVIGGYSTPTGMLAINYLNYKKRKFILSSDGGIANKNENKLIEKLKKYYISSAEYWLSTGNDTSDYLKYYGANLDNVYIYPFTTIKKNDILKDLIEDKEKEILKKKLKIKEEKVILSVGQFIYRKGFDVLLEASKNIPKSTGIYIVGGNPTLEYIEKKRALNLNNVHFVGFLNKEELKEYYMISDLFVLPTREDIWGLVINEAMAYGLPIITTDRCIAGVELVKNNENGFIIPINNPKELSLHMNLIIKDTDLQSKIANKNLSDILYFTIENMAQRHLEIFNTILPMKKRDM